MTRFSTLHPDGSESNVREIKQSDLLACPFAILVPEHYRDDGSCKCNDPKHREGVMISEWGYSHADFALTGVLGDKALTLAKLVQALYFDRQWTVEFMREHSGSESWGLAFYDRDDAERFHCVWDGVEDLMGPFILPGASKGTRGDIDGDGVSLYEVRLAEPFVAVLDLVKAGGDDDGE